MKNEKINLKFEILKIYKTIEIKKLDFSSKNSFSIETEIVTMCRRKCQTNFSHFRQDQI